MRLVLILLFVLVLLAVLVVVALALALPRRDTALPRRLRDRNDIESEAKTTEPGRTLPR